MKDRMLMLAIFAVLLVQRRCAGRRTSFTEAEDCVP